ncbi:hypothetical protein RJ641_011930 [Dillenia turbinata]|uniref:Uncharacterized protein n=1 Tax=Dillenia turbinata TaxID=194707 RepID=A0AAN8Z5K1_9MAGN
MRWPFSEGSCEHTKAAKTDQKRTHFFFFWMNDLEQCYFRRTINNFLFVWLNEKQSWGQLWWRQGHVSHRATGSKVHVSARAIVLLFARQKAFMEVTAEGSVAVASARNIAKIFAICHVYLGDTGLRVLFA